MDRASKWVNLKVDNNIKRSEENKTNVYIYVYIYQKRWVGDGKRAREEIGYNTNTSTQGAWR